MDGDAPSDAQHELSSRLARLAPTEGAHATAHPALYVMRANAPRGCTPLIYEPRLCFVAQGSKQAVLAGQTWRYDPLHYLVVPVTVPTLGEIVEATLERPFLGLRLDIDLDEVGRLLLELGAAPGDPQRVDLGMYAARATPSLLEAVLRLVRLLDAPQDLPVLAPLALREIHYRVLMEDPGQRLRQLAWTGGRGHKVTRAVRHLRDRYLEPLDIAALARSLHMSTSSLHHQFKAATSLSPLQFQKQLRLHEARRRMLMDGMDARTAAFQVGYESASQFSREYRRAFGAPPRRDVTGVRGG